MSGKRSRRKGHDFERKTARFFQENGFPQARTARAESNTLDSCGVDIANVPLLIQCKVGYDKRYPRYPEIRQYVVEQLLEKYDEDNEIHDFPIILIHKPTNDVTYWSIDENFASQLIKNYFESQKILSRCIKAMQSAKAEIISLEETLAQCENNVSFKEEFVLQNNSTYDKLHKLYQDLKAFLD